MSKPTPLQIIGDQGKLPSKLSETLQANLKAAQSAAATLAKEKRQSSLSDISNQRSLSSFLFNEQDSPLFKDLSSEDEKKQAVEYARMMHVPYGTEIENISLDHVGYENNYAGTDGMPEGGYTRLIDELAKDIESNGGQIQLGRIVEKITSLGQGKGIEVQFKKVDENGKTEIIQARTAIVTIPLAVLQNSRTKDLFEPQLESNLRQTIDKVTIGNLNKVLLTYKEPWWSLEAGTFVVLPVANKATTSTENNEDAALMDIFASTTLIANSLCASNTGLPSLLMSPSLLVMIGASSAKKLEKFSRLQVAKALDRYLSPRLSSNDRKEASHELQHTFYSRWGKQEFTGGATTTPVTVGNNPSDFITLAKPQWNDSLYFAGEHCEVNHRGSVAGSVVSAQTTSDLVLKHLAVNTSPAARH